MSSGGHMIDAVNRMRFNRNQLMARRERIQKLKESYNDVLKYEGYQYHEDDIPKEVVEKVKAQIRKDLKKKRRNMIIYSVSITLGIISALILFVIKLNSF